LGIGGAAMMFRSPPIVPHTRRAWMIDAALAMGVATVLVTVAIGAHALIWRKRT